MELKLILDKLIGKKGAGGNALKKGKIAGVDWDKMQDQPPLNELKAPGFFAMLILPFLLMELVILPLQIL